MRCFYLLMLLLSTSLYGQDTLKIQGQIDPAMNGKVMKMYLIPPFSTSQTLPGSLTCVINNGTFSFAMPANGVELYGFSLTHNGKHSGLLVLAPQETKIIFLDTLLNDFEVSGNEINAVDKELKKKSKLSGEKEHDFYLNWIQQNIDSPLSSIYLYIFHRTIPEDEVERLFNLIPEKNKLNSWSKDLNNIRKYFIGKPAIDFSQSDPNGKDVRLSDFKGKYVLLEFWAAWCSPCRAENPNLVKVYQTYHKKGFEILAVSLDEDKQAWINAIKEDGLIWTHVSDLKGWKNTVSRDIYTIYSIPNNILISPEGKIIARKLSAATLEVLLKDKLN